MLSQTVSLPVEEDVQAASPTLLMDLETDGWKGKECFSKRPDLTDLEMDCGKATCRTAISTRPVCHKKLPKKFKDCDTS